MMRAMIKKTEAKEPFSFCFINVYGDTLVRSENYTARSSAMNGIASVKKNCISDKRYELKESKNGKFFFNIKASNGQVVATSAMFATQALRDAAVSQMKNEAPRADVFQVEAVE